MRLVSPNTTILICKQFKDTKSHPVVQIIDVRSLSLNHNHSRIWVETHTLDPCQPFYFYIHMYIHVRLLRIVYSVYYMHVTLLLSLHHDYCDPHVYVVLSWYNSKIEWEFFANHSLGLILQHSIRAYSSIIHASPKQASLPSLKWASRLSLILLLWDFDNIILWWLHLYYCFEILTLSNFDGCTLYLRLSSFLDLSFTYSFSTVHLWPCESH